ncbi:Leucine-rich repeat-containing protein 43 [Irineochytrium annulatum]|nr:Leucine-rich repeat-containing protein 43 [Irineochytrium annulatum]
MATLTSTFRAILNETIGIRLHEHDASDSKLGVMRQNLPPLPSLLPAAKPVDDSDVKKPKNRTDSAFDTVALHTPKIPLSVADLLDEEAEGVWEDWEVDLWSREPMSWSDEAQQLKALQMRRDQIARLEFKKLEAEFDKRAKELVLRGQLPSNTVRERADDQRTTFTDDFVFAFFKSLRLVDRGIKTMDAETERFKNLSELSITGNLLQRLEHLPANLAILHANANHLTSCPDLSRLSKLVHVGIGYNHIKSLNHVDSPAPDIWLAPQLTSIDLAGNELTNIDETVTRNPISLLKVYRQIVLSKLKGLILFDEQTVTAAERVLQQEKTVEDKDTTDIDLVVNIQEITGIDKPEIVEPDDRPPDEVRYSIEATFEGYNTVTISTNQLPWQEQLIDFKSLTTVVFPVTKQTRDTFMVGALKLRLICRRHSFQHREVPPDPPEGLAPVGADGRPTSGAQKKPEPPKPAPKKVDPKAKKGKKKPVVDDEALFIKVLALEKELGHCRIEMNGLLDGEPVIGGDYHLESGEEVNAEGQTIPDQCHATFRMSISLNPVHDPASTIVKA